MWIINRARLLHRVKNNGLGAGITWDIKVIAAAAVATVSIHTHTVVWVFFLVFFKALDVAVWLPFSQHAQRGGKRLPRTCHSHRVAHGITKREERERGHTHDYRPDREEGKKKN